MRRSPASAPGSLPVANAAPTCASIRCKDGYTCVKAQCIKLEPEPAMCCKALTASCLACAAGVTPAEYCETNPRTSGCKSTALVALR